MIRFDQVVQGAEIVRRTGPNPEIAGVEYDSRRIGREVLFLAIQGGTTDGNRYIGRALSTGSRGDHHRLGGSLRGNRAAAS